MLRPSTLTKPSGDIGTRDALRRTARLASLDERRRTSSAAVPPPNFDGVRTTEDVHSVRLFSYHEHGQIMNGSVMPHAVSRLRAQLAELGVMADVDPLPPSGEAEGAIVTLARGAFQQTYRLIEEDKTVPRALTPGHGVIPIMVFRSFVSPRTAEAFRRSGIQYLDSAGNAWVEFGDVLIDVRGRPRPAEAGPAAPVSGNLFTRGRAQVIFALLAWPRLWDQPQRELAAAAGVSLGQAHNTLALLAEAGYDGARPRPGQTGLLDLWAAAFPTGLARHLTLATYRGDVDGFKPTRAEEPVWLSGEQAVTDLLRPASMTLYVEEFDPHLAVANRWRSDGEPNVVVRHKFWNAPDDAPSSGVLDAPWPLVYADLLASRDSRVRGAATDWRDRHAGTG